MNHRKTIACNLILWALIVGCYGDGPSDVSDPPSEERPDQILERSTITFSSGGRRTVVLKADFIAKYRSKPTEVKQVNVDFFDRNGAHISTLTSRQGTVDEQTESMEVEGEVVVVSDRGIRLETERLRWDPKRRKITSDVFVKITRGEEVITGVGLETDPDLESVIIKQNVQGRTQTLEGTEL